MVYMAKRNSETGIFEITFDDKNGKKEPHYYDESEAISMYSSLVGMYGTYNIIMVDPVIIDIKVTVARWIPKEKT